MRRDGWDTRGFAVLEERLEGLLVLGRLDFKI